jgi:hypothetical protein
MSQGFYRVHTRRDWPDTNQNEPIATDTTARPLHTGTRFKK